MPLLAESATGEAIPITEMELSSSILLVFGCIGMSRMREEMSAERPTRLTLFRNERITVTFPKKLGRRIVVVNYGIENGWITNVGSLPTEGGE